MNDLSKIYGVNDPQFDVSYQPDLVTAPRPTMHKIMMHERRQSPMMQRQTNIDALGIGEKYDYLKDLLKPSIDATIGIPYNKLQSGLEQGEKDMQEYVTNPLYEKAQMEMPGFKKMGLNALGNLSAMVSDVPPVVSSFADPYDPVNLAGMGMGGVLKLAESTQMIRKVMAKDREISELQRQLNSFASSGDKDMIKTITNKLNKAQNEREVFTSHYNDLLDKEQSSSGFKKFGVGSAGMGVLPPEYQSIIDEMTRRGIKQPDALKRILSHEGNRFDPKDASIVTGDVVLNNGNNFAHATSADFDKFKRGSQTDKSTGYGGQFFGDASYFDDSPLANSMGNLAGVMDASNASKGKIIIAKPNKDFGKYAYLNTEAPFTDLMSDMPEVANKIHAMGGYQPLHKVIPVTDFSHMSNYGATPDIIKMLSDKKNVNAGTLEPRTTSFMIKAALGSDRDTKPARNIAYADALLNEGVGGSFMPSIKRGHSIIPNAKEWAIHDPSTMDIVDKINLNGKDLGDVEDYLDLLHRMRYGK